MKRYDDFLIEQIRERDLDPQEVCHGAGIDHDRLCMMLSSEIIPSWEEQARLASFFSDNVETGFFLPNDEMEDDELEALSEVLTMLLSSMKQHMIENHFDHDDWRRDEPRFHYQRGIDEMLSAAHKSDDPGELNKVLPYNANGVNHFLFALALLNGVEAPEESSSTVPDMRGS